MQQDNLQTLNDTVWLLWYETKGHHTKDKNGFWGCIHLSFCLKGALLVSFESAGCQGLKQRAER